MLQLNLKVIVRAKDESDHAEIEREIKEKIEKDTYPSLSSQNIRVIQVTKAEVIKE